MTNEAVHTYLTEEKKQERLTIAFSRWVICSLSSCKNGKVLNELATNKCMIMQTNFINLRRFTHKYGISCVLSALRVQSNKAYTYIELEKKGRLQMELTIRIKSGF